MRDLIDNANALVFSTLVGAKEKLSDFGKDKSGATAIEYGLIAALISVVVITTVSLIGDNLDATFQKVADELGAPAGD